MAALSPEGGKGKARHAVGLLAGIAPAPVQPPGFHVGLGRRGGQSGTDPATEARGFGSRQPPPSACVTEFPLVLR